MKRMLKVSFTYVFLALCGGVFYREFTKFNGFTGKTVLADTHVHLMVLGVFMFMILALFAKSVPLLEDKNFKKAFILYNVGVLWTVSLLIIRGITQVLALTLSNGATAAISGIAGLGHIILGIGLVWLMMILLRVSEKENS